MTDWRVDPANRMNLYRGNEYAGVMFNPEVAWFVVEAMNGEAPKTVPADTEPRTDHTPLTMVQEIQEALVSAGLDIRNVAVNAHIDPNGAQASILSVGADYSSVESDRLADILSLSPVYRENGKPEKRIATLDGYTTTGIQVTIHCQPRMTAEEVAEEMSRG